MWNLRDYRAWPDRNGANVRESVILVNAWPDFDKAKKAYDRSLSLTIVTAR
jgi:hypothetical protein